MQLANYQGLQMEVQSYEKYLLDEKELMKGHKMRHYNINTSMEVPEIEFDLDSLDQTQ